MTLSIREAIAADAEMIVAVRMAAARDLTARFGQGFWSSNTTEAGVLSAMKRGRTVVAVDGAEIVGTLTLSKKKPWAIDAGYFTRSRLPIYLTSMAVDPGSQGKGIGRAMLADVERRVRAWPEGPGDAIRLDAFDSDAGAGGFYAKCGYVERGRALFRAAPLIYFERLLLTP